MSLKDDLIAARALIDTPEKWGKVEYIDDGVMCALGACAIVADFNPYAPWREDARADAMAQALIASLPKPFSNVPAFNDEPATNYLDIMDLFDRAINAASIASLDAAIAECAKPLPRNA